MQHYETLCNTMHHHFNTFLAYPPILSNLSCVCLYKSSNLKAWPHKTYHLQATSNDENFKWSLTLGVLSAKILNLANNVNIL